jgi:NAD(P)-dependent dehydrogenase (short-subunit alcohol dehydrogenase family)
VDWTSKTAIVTGGASGIGKALAEALHARGARVAIADLDRAAAETVGAACGGFGAAVDVGDEAQLVRFLNLVERRLGPVDAFFANAGLGVTDGPGWGAGSAPNAAWDLCWRVNVMHAVYAARHLIPGMTARGGGIFVVTASAAGFLNSIGDSAYTATKHAAVSFAESVAIAHGDEGIQAHVLAPEGVNTPLVKGIEHGAQGLSGYLEPELVARKTLEAIDDKRFRVFTHDNTADYAAMRVAEPDRWLGGMRKIRRELVKAHGRPL